MLWASSLEHAILNGDWYIETEAKDGIDAFVKRWKNSLTEFIAVFNNSMPPQGIISFVTELLYVHEKRVELQMNPTCQAVVVWCRALEER